MFIETAQPARSSPVGAAWLLSCVGLDLFSLVRAMEVAVGAIFAGFMKWQIIAWQGGGESV
jgi:hypothetical protein